MTETAYFSTLKNRGLITLTGSSRKTFLQGLITNDINNLKPSIILYACLLSPQGKFLHDMFLHEDNDTLLIDCEGGDRALDLHKRLMMYKLRADVTLQVQENHTIYGIIGAEHGLTDPRHAAMGYRSFEKPADLPEQAFEVWDEHRIKLCIPDGSRDLMVNKSTMDEARMDTLSAIDYNKGCYIGQELTARMHYRGLGKKHLQTVRIDKTPESAQIRSQSGEWAIALVRDAAQ